MYWLKRKRSFPPSVRILMGAFSVLGVLLSIGSAPQAVQDTLKNIPFLGQPIPWVVLAALAVVLGFLAVSSGTSTAPEERDTTTGLESPEEDTPEGPGAATRVPPFYEDQQAMLDARWGIESAVQDPDVRRVWFALGTGYHFNDLPDEQIKRCIERMVLSKPNADLLNGIYRDNPDRLEYAVKNIHRAYEKAKGNGVDVRVSDVLSLQGLLVFKKDSAEDWARIQTPLPPNEADQWPSLVVRRKDHEALFVRIEGAFNALHDAGELLAIKAEETAPPGSREPILRLQEVVKHGRVVRSLWEFVEISLLPAVSAVPPDLPMDNRPGFYMSESIKREVVRPCRDAFARWSEASTDENLATEEALRAFFKMYTTFQELRTSVEQCRLVLGVDELGHLKGFGDFSFESLAFSERLGDALARGDLYGLRRKISDYHDSHPPADLRFTP